MKRVTSFAMAAAVIAGLTGCAAARNDTLPPLGQRGTLIAADLPPSPDTWPPYPQFSKHSCWARPPIGSTVVRLAREAPSYPPAPQPRPIAPAVVARRLLARLGDSRYVHAIRFSPAPPKVGESPSLFQSPGGRPPADALQARIVWSPTLGPGPISPAKSLAEGIAEYEAEIVGDALRDDLCDAGGAPLVMWGGHFAESGFPLDQRFPNPTPAAFRKRVALVGRRFGFTVASLRLLRPRQIAPLLIVKTQRPRKSFVQDMTKITALLAPSRSSAGKTAQTFEAFFFGVEDAKGPFAYTEWASRNEQEGGEWAANPCLYPYPTEDPIGLNTKACS